MKYKRPPIKAAFFLNPSPIVIPNVFNDFFWCAENFLFAIAIYADIVFSILIVYDLTITKSNHITCSMNFNAVSPIFA